MGEKRTKLLIFVPSLEPGGAERVVTTLLRNLSRKKFDITLAIVSYHDSVFSREIPADIAIIDLQSPRLRFAVLKIVGVIRKVRPDVVFSTIDYLNFTLAATRPLWPSRTRFIARPTILFSAALERNSRPRLWTALTKMALRRTDLFVFQSKAMEMDYREALGWTGGEAVVVPNPLDFDFVRERAESPTPDTCFNPSVFNFIAAGRLEEQKGFDLAIEAFARLKDKTAQLTILGDGSLRAELESLARRLHLEHRVRFLGYIHNPYPYYARADGYLLSSRFEGFPNVVLEALSCGTPVVATPVAGLSCVLEGIRQCRLATECTAVAIADALDSFMRGGRQRVIPDVVSRYDARVVVARYEELFVRASAGETLPAVVQELPAVP